MGRPESAEISPESSPPERPRSRRFDCCGVFAHAAAVTVVVEVGTCGLPRRLIRDLRMPTGIVASPRSVDHNRCGADQDAGQGRCADPGKDAPRGSAAEPLPAAGLPARARCAAEAGGGALVQVCGELGLRQLADLVQQPLELGIDRLVVGRHDIASLSLVTARWIRVPALDSLQPRAVAISELESPAKNLSAMSSRSRPGGSPGRGEPPGAAVGLLGDVNGSDDARVLGVRRQLSLPPSSPQFVERGVAGDAEQPRPRRAALGLKRLRLR